ncbi:endoglucanase protein, partial [Halorhabdus tiamatea SARL4B]
SGTTDGSGTYATTAFLGDHEITVSTDSAETTETVSVSDASGTTTVTVTVEGDASAADDTQPPSVPANLTATDATPSSITVSWDGVTDNGTSGLDQYVVSVDGSPDQTVGVGMTTATIEGLSADSAYEIAVSAVDGAGNESEAATVSATTAASDDGTVGGDGDGGDGTDDEETPAGALVVDDYDGDPGWSSNRNDLGQWCGAGSFENGGGEVEDGALVLEYDNAGWFVEQIGQDVSEYSDLVMVLGGDDAHADEFLLDIGGVRGLLSRFTDDTIGSSASAVTVDMESAGIDPSTGGLSVRLNFWQGGSGTLEIEEIRFQ